MSEHPNTLRDVYAQAFRLTFGVLKFRARMIVTSQRTWRWVASVSLLIAAMSMPGYEFGKNVLPYVLLTCVSLLGHRLVLRARHALASRRRNSRKFSVDIRLSA